MRIRVGPAHQLLRALIPGELVSLSEARARAELSESALAESVAVLTAVFPQLATPPGALQLNTNPDLLDPERFCGLLSDPLSARLSHVAISAVCVSTNSEVMTIGTPAANKMNIAISEYQTGGRGRQGRSWKSAFAGGLCLTVARRFGAGVRIEPTLTLAVGVQLANVLDAWLTRTVLLKWPNDLILGDGKLGGILVELSTLPGGDQLLRVGAGINCDAPDIMHTSDGLPSLPPAAMADHLIRPLDRSRLAAELATGIVDALDTHLADGFGAFRTSWQDRDYLRHQQVQVFSDERVRYGTATGIDERGALCVSTDEGVLTLMSGEVRVRRR
jgi:BirA family biotin operon repressor/biotin-[acetyl-CoA-carboxylase] ligase